MPLATVYSRAKLGINAPLVTVEVHLSGGLPTFNIVGLPEATVRESRDRVRSALINSRFDFPVSRITVNLAPADLPKEGGRFDLPIAIGILLASGQVPAAPLKDLELIGELGLSGELRAVDAALPAAIHANAAGHILILPAANSGLASIVDDTGLREAESLLAVAAHLHGQQVLPFAGASADPIDSDHYPDLADVKGQTGAKRALEIAAAGGHSLLLSGPPGTGKTLLANRLPGILPPLTESERLDIATVQSVAGKPLHLHRPFRAPHHTASAAALVGGGSYPRPGEISLAHNGVLFLDELPEYPRKVLEVLREPMESGEVIISRAAQQLKFPAKFQLVAAMNPCPCGYDGDENKDCRCTPDQIQRYRSKLSGPLLDRIDLRINVPRLPPGVLQSDSKAESSAAVRERVCKARARQHLRSPNINARLSADEVANFCPLDQPSKQFMLRAEQKLGLSARAHHRLIKIARTIADLSGDQNISLAHLQEAMIYRGDQ
ncbi:YifB family Mg chelatase-like AAA ATPase [uncultured Zhongshania sp.]|uniref:YifB family Mg chelatase-like AAA ATPase n=1 Tax=uncultured Zhongshania sp. TaxID=1642288 RepID=UPI0030DC6617|tara:strand:+ start:2038 stop:3519 length:1482 start_codon:yes stop_codon:yes gene_type:complete